MVRRIHDRRLRRTAVQSAVAAVVVLVSIASAWQFFPARGDFSYGEITCTEVEAGLQDYVAGKLPAERMQQYRFHLDRCPRCKALMEQMEQLGGIVGQTVADAHVPGRLMLADGSSILVRGAHTP
jgi:hypothetical protein